MFPVNRNKKQKRLLRGNQFDKWNLLSSILLGAINSKRAQVGRVNVFTGIMKHDRMFHEHIIISVMGV